MLFQLFLSGKPYAQNNEVLQVFHGSNDGKPF